MKKKSYDFLKLVTKTFYSKVYKLYCKKPLLIKAILCSESLWKNNQQSQFDNNIAVGLFEGETTAHCACLYTLTRALWFELTKVFLFENLFQRKFTLSLSHCEKFCTDSVVPGVLCYLNDEAHIFDTFMPKSYPIDRRSNWTHPFVLYRLREEYTRVLTNSLLVVTKSKVRWEWSCEVSRFQDSVICHVERNNLECLPCENEQQNSI